MQHQKYAAMLVLCTTLLFSCHTNQSREKNNSSFTKPQAIIPIPGNTDISLSEEIQNFIQSNTQQFNVPAKKVTAIIARQGLKVIVDPAALQKPDGSPVEGNVVVNIVELTTAEDLLRANAATVSNGKLLSSGGSYYVGMSSDGVPLQVRKGQAINISIPKLQDNEMELFYGKRDSLGKMNWIQADQPLQFNARDYNLPYNPPYPDSVLYKPHQSKYHLYDSTGSKVIFSGKSMSIKEMVDELQRRGIDKVIDTVTINMRDVGFDCYGIRNADAFVFKRYRIISCCERDKERDSAAKAKQQLQKYLLANEKYTEQWQKENYENSLAGSLQQYYTPSSLGQLGWINCDRFYNQPQDTNMPVELPITFSQQTIQYFIIYRSVNGLISGTLTSNDKAVLKNLPEKQNITLVAFAKNNGLLYEYKEDLVTEKNKTIKMNFKQIPAAALKDIFGNNIRI
ncbi:MAG: hypothetical protein JST86_07840 [Bacteroidetes bacterium]|nr:hypothetical protein [Bacteroidota bacterium]